ncbi:hypothetical protein ACFQ9Y_26550 [Peribacillus simplex]|uniref:hypothetical protein n=1 Tax=Peribacillus simplex TaxID=1478 RepID=UPI0036708B82
MKELAELKRIVDGQKTVTTKRLKPLLDEIQKSYIQTANKVKSQKETIKKVNSNYSVANSKALGYRYMSRLMRNLKGTFRLKG